VLHTTLLILILNLMLCICTSRFICDWLDYIKALPPGGRPNYEFLRSLINSCDNKYVSAVHAAARLAPADASPGKRARSGTDTEASADSNDWAEEEVQTSDDDSHSPYSSMQCEDEDESEEEEEEEAQVAPSATVPSAPAAKKAKTMATLRED
jgi:hypothetical protein